MSRSGPVPTRTNDAGTRGARIGSSGDTAERGVTIEDGVQIAGRTVDLLAQVSLLDLDAKAHATAYSPIFFGVASAFAVLTSTSTRTSS